MMEKKIVIIVPYRGIGDLIFHIPFFKGLYLKYNSKLIIFTNSANKAKNILQNEFYIKKIKYLNFQRENQIKNSFSLLKEINKIKSDLCILTAPSKRLVLPLFMSNSKKKVFFKKENTKDLSLYIFKQSKKNFSNIYFKKNYDLRFKKKIDKKKVFISIDSHHDTNNWDVNNYILLVKKMIKNHKFKEIYINFAPSKIKQFNKILNEFSRNKKIIFTYNENFDDIIRIINNSHYVIGNESGPICIAASLKKKIHSIYFPKYTNKSSKTIYKNVSFYNTDIIKPENIISKIFKRIC